ncbi:MAG: hypothetical protein OXF02_03420 [Simkaniaceae bacterium]|nr:hypothetical protein [Simkaniaceae bacterium]
MKPIGFLRLKERATPELEEVVVEQPKCESPSPEPVPTAPAWWNPFGGFFAKPNGATESVDESSV